MKRSSLSIVVDLFSCLMNATGTTLRAVKGLAFRIRGKEFGRTSPFPSSAPVDNGRDTDPNPLLQYFLSHREGPGIWKWLPYFDVYHRHLGKFANTSANILEIGIFSGGSLRMWKNYFGSTSRIYGVDIEEACRTYADEQTEIYIGDQADPEFWQRVKNNIPMLDVIIDDGGHLPEQQRVTLEEMLPHLRPGGVYICEDIHGNSNEFAAYVQGLADNLNTATLGPNPEGVLSSPLSPFQASINSIHFYPFIAVIEKRERPLAHLMAPRHGTQWQPFA